MIRRMSDEPYPPIGDYALLGDMHSCALVSKSGSVDWCCWPRFDSPSVCCSAPLQEVEGGFHIEPRLSAGEKLAAAVKYESLFSHEAQALDLAELEERLEETVRFWRQWSSACSYDGEYLEDVLRSALTIKAMTYAPSGALLAAATTSLPEVIGGERNWDYRFTWIRDAT